MCLLLMKLYFKQMANPVFHIPSNTSLEEKQIPQILWKPNVHYNVQKASHTSILSPLIPLDDIQFYSIITYMYIVIPSTPRSSK